MTHRALDFWFKVDLPKGTKVVYLVLAPTVEKARERMGLFAEGRILRHISWQEIVELTGCKKPDKAHSTEMARGGLLMQHNDKWVYLWTGVNLEL